MHARIDLGHQMAMPPPRTPQERANILLEAWQGLRHLQPQERMIRLPIIPDDDAPDAANYQAQLDAVAAAMQEAA